MSEFYDDMAEMVQELLDPIDGLGQDDISLVVITKSTPPNSWTPAVDTEAVYPLRAVARRVNQRYSNGTLVVATGDIVTFAPIEDVEPEVGHFMFINGSRRAFVDLKRIPASGTVVAWQVFCEL